MKNVIVIFISFISLVNLCFAQNFPIIDDIVNIQTPNESNVEAIDYYPLDQGYLDYCDDLIETFSGITVTDNATSDYNCHGWAWHVSEGGSRYWINDLTISDNPNLSKYWTDGSYIQLQNSDDQEKIYYNGYEKHSAIYYDATYYESKWGYCHRVIHTPNNLPDQWKSDNKIYYATPKISGDSLLCYPSTHT